MNKLKNPKLSKISVVIPVYNATKIVKYCLEALKKQTDSNYEVILVDDYSIDSSLDICKESGFKTLSLPVNKGQAVARNEGVKYAQGEIIVFADSDVIVPPDWLTKYRQLLTKYVDADMICSGYGNSVSNSAPALFAFYESLYRRQQLPTYISSTISSNCAVYKRTFEEIGGYPEYYICAKKDSVAKKAVAVNEDAELGFLFSEKGARIVWSHDNPVKHYFRDSWKGYLRQQAGFSRYAVLSIFKFPKMLYSKDIYSKQRIMSQLMIVLAMHLALLGLFFGKMGILTTVFIEISSILSFYSLNRKFISYLKANMKTYSSLYLFFWLIVSRASWIYGVMLGLRDGCYMLCNNRAGMAKI